MIGLFPRLDDLSKEELAEVHYNLNGWKWDNRIGPKPSDWEEIPNYKPYYIRSKSLYVAPILYSIENRVGDKYCLWWFHKNILGRKSRLRFEYWWYFKSTRSILSRLQLD